MFMHLGMVGSSFKGIKIAGLAVLFTVLAAFNPRPFRAANAGVPVRCRRFGLTVTEIYKD